MFIATNSSNVSRESTEDNTTTVHMSEEAERPEQNVEIQEVLVKTAKDYTRRTRRPAKGMGAYLLNGGLKSMSGLFITEKRN